MTLEKYAPQLSNCFLLNDSWDMYTENFKLLPSKWLLRYIHRNFQTASFWMTLEIYAQHFSNCLLLVSLEIYTPQLLNCFLSNDSWDICTATFTLLPSKWLLRYMYTATFKLLPCKWLLRYMYTATFTLLPLNDSWEICTTTFTLLPCKWLLRNMHCNFKTASF